MHPHINGGGQLRSNFRKHNKMNEQLNIHSVWKGRIGFEVWFKTLTNCTSLDKENLFMMGTVFKSGMAFERQSFRRIRLIRVCCKLRKLPLKHPTWWSKTTCCIGATWGFQKGKRCHMSPRSKSQHPLDLNREANLQQLETWRCLEDVLKMSFACPHLTLGPFNL